MTDSDKLLKQLVVQLHASLVAHGSEGTTLPRLVSDFKEDWNEDLQDYANKLGYERGNGMTGVLQMLRAFTEEVTVVDEPNGQITVQLIPKAESKANLDLINLSKKAKDEEERKKPGSVWQRKAKTAKFTAANQANIAKNSGRTATQPPLPTGHLNPNLIPLGPIRRFSSSQPAPSLVNGAKSKKSKQKAAKPLRSILNSSLPRSQTIQRNDFGDVFRGNMRPHAPFHDSSNIPYEKNRAVSPPTSSQAPSSSQENRQNFDNGWSKEWRMDGDSDAYYDEDFRAPPSIQGSRNVSPENRFKTHAADECSTSANALAVDHNQNEGILPVADEYDEEEGEEEEEPDSELDFGEESNELDYLEDGEEVKTFLGKYDAKYQPIPADIYRAVHILSSTNGNCMDINSFGRAYSSEYKTAFSTKERNRILGVKTTANLAKESFKKCVCPGLFTVKEKLSTYAIEVAACMAEHRVEMNMIGSQSGSADLTTKPTLKGTNLKASGASSSIMAPTSTAYLGVVHANNRSGGFANAAVSPSNRLNPASRPESRNAGCGQSSSRPITPPPSRKMASPADILRDSVTVQAVGKNCVDELFIDDNAKSVQKLREQVKRRIKEGKYTDIRSLPVSNEKAIPRVDLPIQIFTETDGIIGLERYRPSRLRSNWAEKELKKAVEE